MVIITALNIYQIIHKQQNYNLFSVAAFECKRNGGRIIHQHGFGHNKLRGDGGRSENKVYIVLLSLN